MVAFVAANDGVGTSALPERNGFQALFDQAPCGYLITDDAGVIELVNDTFIGWSGYEREQLLGTSLQTLLPIGDRILYSTHCIPQLGINGAIAEIVIEIIAADGTRRAALLSAARTPPTEATAASVRVIIFSAHERRLYEQELVDALRRAQESDGRRAVAEADLRHRVLHDPLTGLPNRPGLVEHLADMTGVKSTESTLGVLFIDLDHFKTINDSLGHGAGDQLLAAVAARLRTAVRTTAVIARFAGDEFVVVDAFAREDQATVLAQRLLDVVNMPIVIEGLEVVPSASIGVVVADASRVTPEELLRCADLAMYRAKARGRNCWEQHDPNRVDPTVHRLRLLGELRHGIDNDELRLYYQPRIDLRTGQIDGFEALVRWQHPNRGLLSPAAFIAAAEEAGLIRSLGEWVLDRAIAQARRWNDDPSVGVRSMAINLSARQLTDTRLLELVGNALERHRLPASQITLEITETAVMLDPDSALRSLNALKTLGVCLAVDDFGTGYSSLTYLNRFPVDELKIDQSFVAGLGKNKGDSAIVASCIQLAHAMGVRAVAEGIETAEHHSALTTLGCDMAQGYYYSRPLSATDTAVWTNAPHVRRPWDVVST